MKHKMYRLLIADRDSSALERVKGLLDWKHYGFELIAEAAAYGEAANLALDLEPHVALIDAGRDYRKGIELVRRLRAVGLRTVFCVISDSADPECVHRAIEAGAQDYLLKPLSASQLQVFVEKTLAGGLNRFSTENTSRQEADPILHLEYAALSKHTNKLLMMVYSEYSSPPITLTSIAESLHMNSKYLGRIFLRETGMKFSEYLLAYRMEEAKRLIIGTREKISAVANTVGYPQLNRFYVHFRNYFGISPSTLRRSDVLLGEDSPQEGDKL